MNEATKLKAACQSGLQRATREGLRPAGRVELVQTRNGVVVDKRIADNLVVTTGKSQAAKYWIGTGGNPMTYIAVGTGATAPAAGDGALQAEITDSGLGRKADSSPSVTGNEATISVTWNVTGSKAVTESGIFNASGGGVMGARVTFAALNVANGDTLSLTWKFTFG